MVSLAASATCALLATVGSIGCLVSLRNTGTLGSDSAVVAAAGAGTLALWFALRAARDGAGSAHGGTLRLGAGATGGVAALALSLLLVIVAGGFHPLSGPPDDRVAALREAARARWQKPTGSDSGSAVTRSGEAPGLRYPDRSDRERIQGELSRLGTRGVERAESLLRRSIGSLEGVTCRYTEPEPAWAVEGQMVYRLVFRCEGFDEGHLRKGMVTLGVSFLWRDDTWIEGWKAGGPVVDDAVTMLPDQ